MYDTHIETIQIYIEDKVPVVVRCVSHSLYTVVYNIYSDNVFPYDMIPYDSLSVAQIAKIYSPITLELHDSYAKCL